MPLNDRDIERYVSDGYLVVASVMLQAQVDDLQQEIARFARSAYPVDNPRSTTKYPTEDAVANSILAINFPHRVSELTRALAQHEKIVHVLRQIVGAHMPYWDGSIKLAQTIFYNKPPGHVGQPWHQDELFIPTRDRSLTGAWIALDPATVESGCLWFIPKTHRSGRLWPTRPTVDRDEYEYSDESHGFDSSNAVPIEASPGDVVFFNGYLLHSSRRNRSSSFRRALVAHYCSASTLLPWLTPPRAIQSSEIAQLDNRAVVVIGEDPYSWKEVQEPRDQVILRPFE